MSIEDKIFKAQQKADALTDSFTDNDPILARSEALKNKLVFDQLAKMSNPRVSLVDKLYSIGKTQQRIQGIEEQEKAYKINKIADPTRYDNSYVDQKTGEVKKYSDLINYDREIEDYSLWGATKTAATRGTAELLQGGGKGLQWLTNQTGKGLETAGTLLGDITNSLVTGEKIYADKYNEINKKWDNNTIGALGVANAITKPLNEAAKKINYKNLSSTDDTHQAFSEGLIEGGKELGSAIAHTLIGSAPEVAPALFGVVPGLVAGAGSFMARADKERQAKALGISPGDIMEVSPNMTSEDLIGGAIYGGLNLVDAGILKNAIGKGLISKLSDGTIGLSSKADNATKNAFAKLRESNPSLDAWLKPEGVGAKALAWTGDKAWKLGKTTGKVGGKVGIAAGLEGGAEMGQTLLEQWANGDLKDRSWDKNWEDIKEAGLMGAYVGGALKAPHAVYQEGINTAVKGWSNDRISSKIKEKTILDNTDTLNVTEYNPNFKEFIDKESNTEKTYSKEKLGEFTNDWDILSIEKDKMTLEQQKRYNELISNSKNIDEIIYNASRGNLDTKDRNISEELKESLTSIKNNILEGSRNSNNKYTPKNSLERFLIDHTLSNPKYIANLFNTVIEGVKARYKDLMNIEKSIEGEIKLNSQQASASSILDQSATDETAKDNKNKELQEALKKDMETATGSLKEQLIQLINSSGRLTEDEIKTQRDYILKMHESARMGKNLDEVSNAIKNVGHIDRQNSFKTSSKEFINKIKNNIGIKNNSTTDKELKNEASTIIDAEINKKHNFLASESQKRSFIKTLKNKAKELVGEKTELLHFYFLQKDFEGDISGEKRNGYDNKEINLENIKVVKGFKNIIEFFKRTYPSNAFQIIPNKNRQEIKLENGEVMSLSSNIYTTIMDRLENIANTMENGNISEKEEKDRLLKNFRRLAKEFVDRITSIGSSENVPYFHSYASYGNDSAGHVKALQSTEQFLGNITNDINETDRVLDEAYSLLKDDTDFADDISKWKAGYNSLTKQSKQESKEPKPETKSENNNLDAKLSEVKDDTKSKQTSNSKTKQEPSNDSSLTNEEYNDENKTTQGDTNDNSGKSQQDERSRDSKNESRGLRKIIETMFGRDVSDILREGRTNETISTRLRGVCKRWLAAKCSGLRYDERILGTRKFYANIDGKIFRDVFKEVYTFLGDNLNVDILEESAYKNNINYLSEDGLSGFSITPDGDLVSVFNASPQRGFLKDIASFIQENVKTLNCFQGSNNPIAKMYMKTFGFKIASVLDFNYDIFSKDKGEKLADSFVSQYGETPVVFMINPLSYPASNLNESTIRWFDKNGYEEAVYYQKEGIQKIDEANDVIGIDENREEIIDEKAHKEHIKNNIEALDTLGIEPSVYEKINPESYVSKVQEENRQKELKQRQNILDEIIKEVENNGKAKDIKAFGKLDEIKRFLINISNKFRLKKNSNSLIAKLNGSDNKNKVIKALNNVLAKFQVTPIIPNGQDKIKNIDNVSRLIRHLTLTLRDTDLSKNKNYLNPSIAQYIDKNTGKESLYVNNLARFFQNENIAIAGVFAIAKNLINSEFHGSKSFDRLMEDWKGLNPYMDENLKSFLQKGSITTEKLATKLALDTLEALGWEFDKSNIKLKEYDSLVQEMGFQIINAMVNAEIVNITNVKNKDLFQYSENPEAVTQFISLNSANTFKTKNSYSNGVKEFDKMSQELGITNEFKANTYSTEPIVKSSRQDKTKFGRMKLPKFINDIFNKFSSTPFTIHNVDRLKRIFLGINPDGTKYNNTRFLQALKKQEGYIDISEFLNPDGSTKKGINPEYFAQKTGQVLGKLESIKGKNREVEESIQAIIDLLNDKETYKNGNIQIYFDRFFGTGRNYISSSTINPQSTKLHRYLIIPDTSYKTEKIQKDKNGKIELSYSTSLGIAQAFGFSTDKKVELKDLANNRKNVKEFATAILNASPKEIYDAIIKNMENGKAELAGYEIEIEEIAHALNAYMNIVNIQDAVKQNASFIEHCILKEADGINNGLSLKAQIIALTPKSLRLLAGTGIDYFGYLKDTTIAAIFNNQTIKDAYQLLAVNLLQKLDNRDISTNEIIDGARKFGLVKDLVEEDITNKKYENAVNTVKDLINSTRNMVLDTLKLDDGKVTKAARNLLKPIGTVKTYGAGNTASIRKFSSDLFEQLEKEIVSNKQGPVSTYFMHILKISNSTLLNQTNIALDSTEDFNIFRHFFINSPIAFKDMVVLQEDNNTNLYKFIDNIYQISMDKPLDEAVEEVSPYMASFNNSVNRINNFTAELLNNKFKQAASNLLKEKGITNLDDISELTLEEHEYLVNTLSKEASKIFLEVADKQDIKENAGVLELIFKEQIKDYFSNTERQSVFGNFKATYFNEKNEQRTAISTRTKTITPSSFEFKGAEARYGVLMNQQKDMADIVRNLSDTLMDGMVTFLDVFDAKVMNAYEEAEHDTTKESSNAKYNKNSVETNMTTNQIFNVLEQAYKNWMHTLSDTIYDRNGNDVTLKMQSYAKLSYLVHQYFYKVSEINNAIRSQLNLEASNLQNGDITDKYIRKNGLLNDEILEQLGYTKAFDIDTGTVNELDKENSVFSALQIEVDIDIKELENTLDSLYSNIKNGNEAGAIKIKEYINLVNEKLFALDNQVNRMKQDLENRADKAGIDFNVDKLNILTRFNEQLKQLEDISPSDFNKLSTKNLTKDANKNKKISIEEEFNTKVCNVISYTANSILSHFNIDIDTFKSLVSSVKPKWDLKEKQKILIAFEEFLSETDSIVVQPLFNTLEDYKNNPNKIIKTILEYGANIKQSKTFDNIVQEATNETMQSKYKKWAEGISSALMTRLRIKPLTQETKNFAKIIYSTPKEIFSILKDKALFEAFKSIGVIQTNPHNNKISINPKGFKFRTAYNAYSSDVTIAIAGDFSTGGEKLTKYYANSFGKAYLTPFINKSGENGNLLYFLDNPIAAADSIADQLAEIRKNKMENEGTDVITINIAGNALMSMAKNTGLDPYELQKNLNTSMTLFLRRLITGANGRSGFKLKIRSGLQDGVDISAYYASYYTNTEFESLTVEGSRLSIDNYQESNDSIEDRLVNGEFGQIDGELDPSKSMIGKIIDTTEFITPKLIKKLLNELQKASTNSFSENLTKLLNDTISYYSNFNLENFKNKLISSIQKSDYINSITKQDMIKKVNLLFNQNMDEFDRYNNLTEEGKTLESTVENLNNDFTIENGKYAFGNTDKTNTTKNFPQLIDEELIENKTKRSDLSPSVREQIEQDTQKILEHPFTGYLFSLIEDVDFMNKNKKGERILVSKRQFVGGNYVGDSEGHWVSQQTEENPTKWFELTKTNVNTLRNPYTKNGTIKTDYNKAITNFNNTLQNILHNRQDSLHIVLDSINNVEENSQDITLFSQQNLDKSIPDGSELVQEMNLSESKVLSTQEQMRELDGDLKLSEQASKRLKDLLSRLAFIAGKSLEDTKLELYENGLSEHNGSITINNKIKKIMISRGIPESAFTGFVTLEETYAHELLHTLTVVAIFSNKGFTPLGRELMSMYNLYRSKVTPEMLAEDLYSTGQYESRERAKEVANTMFEHMKANDPAGLAEFLTMSQTNEGMNRSLNRVSIKETRDYSNMGFADRLTAKLFDFISDVFDRLVNKYKSDMTMKEAMEILTFRIAKANAKASFKTTTEPSLIEVLGDKLENVNTYLSDKLDSAKHSILKMSGKRNLGITGSPTTSGKFLDMAAIGLLYLSDDRQRGRILDSLHSKGLSYQGIFQNIVEDFMKLSNPKLLVKSFAKISKSIDVIRNKMKDSYDIQIKNWFKTPLTDLENKQLGEGVLDTDLSALLNSYNLDQIIDIIDNTKEYSNKIFDKILKLIPEKDVIHYYKDSTNGSVEKIMREEYINHIKNQADALAYFMVYGTSRNFGEGLALNKNATAIASFLNMGVDNYVPSKEIIQAIDEYVTIKALEKTSPDILNVVRKKLLTEPEAMQQLLTTHRNFKEESLMNNFDGKSLNTMKGYRKNIYDNAISVKIADIKQEKLLASQGFKLIKKIDKLGKRALFISDFVSPSVRFNAQGERFLAQSNKKDLLSKIYYERIYQGEDPDIVKKDLAEAYEYYRHQTFSYARKMTKNNYNIENVDQTSIGNFIPVYDNDGNLIDFSYVLSKKDKKDYLGLDTSISSSLGHMFAHSLDKKESQKLNIKINEHLYKDYKETKEKDYAWKSQFTEFSFRNKDPYVRELFKMMDKDTLKHLKSLFGDDPIMIRTSTITHLFGIRDLDFRRTKFYLENPNHFKKIIVGSLDILKELVAHYKFETVLRLPSVIIGNIMSNIVTCVVYGMSPVEAFTMHKEGLKNLKLYQKQEKALMELLLKRKSGQKVSQQEEDNLRRAMSINPVAPLIKAGLWNSIENFEDVNVTNTENISWTKNKFRKYVAEDSRTQKILDIAYLTNNLYIGRSISNIVQASDFMARYSLYYRLKKQGKLDEKQIIQKITDIFIDYDLPTSPVIKALNDYGLTLFTRYATRVQRALTQMTGDRPLYSALYLAFQVFTGLDFADIFEGAAPVRDWTALIHSPHDNILGALSPATYSIVKDTEKFMGKHF